MFKKNIVLSFSSCYFVYSFIIWMLFYYFPLYFKDLHISDPKIGVLISIFSFTTLFLVAFFGFLADRLSPKKLIQLGILLFLLSISGFCFIQNFTGIFILLLIAGAGSTLFLVSIYSLYYKHLSTARRGKKIGIFLLSSYFGYSLGPLSGGIIFSYWGGKSIFLTAVGLTFLLLFLSNNLKDSSPFKFAFSEYKNDLKRKEVLLLILILFIIGIHIGVEQINYPLFMEENIKLTRLQIGQIFGFIGIWAGIFTLIWGHFFDRHPRFITLFSLSLFICGSFQALTAFANSYLSMLSLRLLHTLGDAFIFVGWGIMITSLFPHKRMGGNFGFAETIRTGGTFLGALISGMLNKNFGYGCPFIFSGLLIILLSLFLLSQREILTRSVIVAERT